LLLALEFFVAVDVAFKWGDTNLPLFPEWSGVEEEEEDDAEIVVEGRLWQEVLTARLNLLVLVLEEMVDTDGTAPLRELHVAMISATGRG
jgi:hypothetical protein